MRWIFLVLLNFTAVLTHAEPEKSQLDAKLNAQFDKFAKARKVLAEKVGCEGEPISRDEWEGLLRLDAPLTNKDLYDLSQQHVAAVSSAKTKAAEQSKSLGIDLRGLGKKNLIRDFCKALPKGAALHVHPDGTLDPQTVVKLLNSSNPMISRGSLMSIANRGFTSCEVDLLKKLPESKQFSELSPSEKATVANLVVMPEKVDSAERFEEFQTKFSYIKNLKGLIGYDNGDPSVAIAKAFLERSRAENVSYVEFTKGCPPFSDAALAEINNEMKDLSSKTGVTAHFNCAFNRTFSPPAMAEEAKGIFESSLRASEKGFDFISGIDLFGYEGQKGDVSALSAQRIYACMLSMREKKNLKMRSTMHAGEHGDVRNPRDAIIMGADRLGHGVNLEKDVVALEYARRQRTAIEINLVSNERLHAVKSLREHPFLKYLRLGLPVSLSTDDEGIFATNMATECEKAIENSDIEYSELKQLSYNSVEAAFVSPAMKQQLKEKLNADFKKFEAQWGSGKIKNMPAAKAAATVVSGGTSSPLENVCLDARAGQPSRDAAISTKAQSR